MGLVRSVFTKSRSIQRQKSQNSYGRNSSLEKKRWKTSVRSYLCGDEHNSILAAEDSESLKSLNFEDEVEDFLSSFRSNAAALATTNTNSTADEETVSVRSSEATVNQPVNGDDHLKEYQITEEKQNSAYKLFKQDDAALTIQSAFRSFRARRARNDEKQMENEKNIDECTKGSPSRESIATSIEVQTGNSSDIFSLKEEEGFEYDVCHQMRSKAPSQVLKLQEEWDDSTVSSVISRMRIQNRLEAASRRERALAYAFAQQLRICSKKKQSATNSNETNMGWNWLERWMAARQPEMLLMEDQISSCCNQTTLARQRLTLDGAAIEEKESCGSNEVSIMNNNVSVPRPVKVKRSKVTTSLSRQNSATTQLCPNESQDLKKVCHVEDEKDKRKRSKNSGNKRTKVPEELETQL